MAEKQPSSNPEPSPQGMLFEQQNIGNGLTDPATYETKQVFKPAPEGVYPEDIPKAPTPFENPDPEFAEANRQNVMTDRRQAAQFGKHSVRRREGSWNPDKLRDGDVLPLPNSEGEGRIIVTPSNRAEARRIAQKLEEERRRKIKGR